VFPGFGWVTLVPALDPANAASLHWLWGTVAVALVTALAWVLSSAFLLPLGRFVARVRGIATGGAVWRGTRR
jgi:hypothetical protein